MFNRLALRLGQTAAAPATGVRADVQPLIDALEATRFWDEEDHVQEDKLKAQVAAEGVMALYASHRIAQLDAEDLAEGGFGAGLLAAGALLRARGFRLDTFATLRLEPDYAVSLNGREYLAYDAADQGASWPLATETFVRMLNENLGVHCKDKAYALYAGNDLMVIFLNPALVPFFDTCPAEERPYTPTRTAPYYGFGEGVAP